MDVCRALNFFLPIGMEFSFLILFCKRGISLWGACFSIHPFNLHKLEIPPYICSERKLNYSILHVDLVSP